MDFPEVIGRGLQGKRGKRVTCSPAATIIIYNIIPYNKKKHHNNLYYNLVNVTLFHLIIHITEMKVQLFFMKSQLFSSTYKIFSFFLEFLKVVLIKAKKLDRLFCSF